MAVSKKAKNLYNSLFDGTETFVANCISRIVEKRDLKKYFEVIVTGEEKIIDTEGRVDRFKARAKKAEAMKAALANKANKAAKEAKKKAEKEA